MDRRHVDDEIRSFIRACNLAWRERRFADLRYYFRSDVAVLPPGQDIALRDRDRVIKSYEDFMTRATVSRFEEAPIDVDAWGEAAAASYRFDITYEMDGTVYEESGREILMLLRSAGEWQIAWRTQVSLPREAATDQAR
jgi:ketosteroid isomerase-like protein